MCSSSSTVKQLQADLKDCEAAASKLHVRLHESEQALAAEQVTLEAERAAGVERQRQAQLLQEGWEHEKSDFSNQEAALARRLEEEIWLKEQLLSSGRKAEFIEESQAKELATMKEQMQEQHLEAAQRRELLELEASEASVRQIEELQTETDAANRLRQEILAWRSELAAAAAHRQYEADCANAERATLSAELDSEVADVAKVRQELSAAQVQVISGERRMDSLTLELEAAQKQQAMAQSRFKDFESWAQAEIDTFLAERNQALRERDAARLEGEEANRCLNEALMHSDKFQQQRDEAYRSQVQERTEANRKVAGLRLVADDVQMQLRLERDQVRRLNEEVGLCARSGAARAAASYLGCISAEARAPPSTATATRGLAWPKHLW